MSLIIRGAAIERVSIIDDDPDARDTFGYAVEELDLVPIKESGPLLSLEALVRQSRSSAQAAICDHHLRKRNYAAFNGADAVAELYRRGVPGLLCTKWDEHIHEMRRLRQFIPVLLRPDQLSPDSVHAAFEQCLEEFDSKFRPTREAIRTLVRIEYVERADGYLGVVVPGWNPNEGIRLQFADLPKEVGNRAAEGARFHVRANIGAERHEDLYFCDWET